MLGTIGCGGAGGLGALPHPTSALPLSGNSPHSTRRGAVDRSTRIIRNAVGQSPARDFEAMGSIRRLTRMQSQSESSIGFQARNILNISGINYKVVFSFIFKLPIGKISLYLPYIFTTFTFI
jgi:hypothetical protein